MTVQRLIQYLEMHSIEVLEHDAYTITVNTVYSNNGVAELVKEVVPANWDAVREYLGY